MNVPSPKSPQVTFADLPNAISLRESEVGALPSNLPDGRKIVPSGQEAVPANPSAMRENNSLTATHGTSGLPSSVSSGSADLSQFLVSRLAARLEKVGSIEYRQTWKAKVTPVGRLYWEHTASVRRISDKGYTGWQTPTTVQVSGRSEESNAKRAAKRLASGRTSLAPGNLEEQAIMYAVPPGIPTTPSSAETEKRVGLNPAHSRWLMGFPPDWDVCAVMAMPSSRR